MVFIDFVCIIRSVRPEEVHGYRFLHHLDLSSPHSAAITCRVVKRIEDWLGAEDMFVKQSTGVFAPLCCSYVVSTVSIVPRYSRAPGGLPVELRSTGAPPPTRKAFDLSSVLFEGLNGNTGSGSTTTLEAPHLVVNRLMEANFAR